MCSADDTGGTTPGGSPGPGAGCCAASRAGFRSIADALQASRAAATYLNSPTAADLDAPPRADALEALEDVGKNRAPRACAPPGSPTTTHSRKPASCRGRPAGPDACRR
jgi:hypothetical protein